MFIKLIKKISSFFPIIKFGANMSKVEYFKMILYKECQDRNCMFFYYYVDHMLKYFSTCKVRDRNKATICLSISTIDTDDDIFDMVNSTMRTVYDISDFNINSCFSMKIRGELKYDDNYHCYDGFKYIGSSDRMLDIQLDVDFDKIKLPKVVVEEK